MSASADRLAATRSRLNSLRFQAQRPAEAPTTNRQPTHPHSTIASYAMTELGGAVSQSLFGRKRLGRSLVRYIARNNQEAEHQRRLSEAKNRAIAVLAQVHSEIQGLEGAIKSKDRVRLLHAIATARGSVRPQTMANRCLAVIDRLTYIEPLDPAESTQAPRRKPREATDSAAILRALERELRQHINRELSRQSPTWWADLVPKSVRDQAEHRRTQRERQWPWAAPEETELIHFVDFKDYGKILTDSRNWDMAFGRIFLDKELVSSKLRELEPIRIEICHSRRLSEKSAVKLRLYSSELIEMIQRQ
jgi:hypothetical protein